jgi:5-hydroxyisourate hydrolase
VTAISTHVLDIARGRPAAGIAVRLERLAGDGPTEIGGGTTDDDGRVPGLTPSGVSTGTYRLVFETAAYLVALSPGHEPFLPEVAVTFRVADASRNYHVPLLLSPFGYSTYRGS